MSLVGVILVRIFPHLDWIRRDTEYFSVFSPNVGKCGPELLRIRTLFTQCKQFDAKIKTSSDLLENDYTNQFKSAEYESDMDILEFFILNLNLGKLFLKLFLNLVGFA